MKRVTEREAKIDLVWKQWSPEEWRAVLTDRRTGAQYEAYSLEELEVALEEIHSARRGVGSGSQPAAAPSTTAVL